MQKLYIILYCCFLSGLTQAQHFNFAEGVEAPFGVELPNDYGIMPSFVDIDGDGDLDLFVHERYNASSNIPFSYFENTGTPEAPSFALPIEDPFGITGGVGTLGLDFVDIDGDGDQDLFQILDDSPGLAYYENTGTLTNPEFEFIGLDPFDFDLSDINDLSFSDLDNDGDQDAIVVYTGCDFKYYHNIGTATQAEFDALSNNTVFGFPSCILSPFLFMEFGDIDQDGDEDLLFHREGIFGNDKDDINYPGGFFFAENEGTLSYPHFKEPIDLAPYFVAPIISTYPITALVDIDNDGDQDAFLGNPWAFRFTFHECLNIGGDFLPTSEDFDLILEMNHDHTFALSDFLFLDEDENVLNKIKITTLPENGALQLDGVPLTTDQEIIHAQIQNLEFIPTQNEFGENYASFEYQVFDGTHYSAADYLVSIDVIEYIYPTSESVELTVYENFTYNFSYLDFPYTDLSGDSFIGIKVMSLPDEGQLLLGNNPVEVDQALNLGSITQFKFIPGLDAIGDPYTSFDFKVFDGIEYSQETYTVSITVVPYLYPTSEDFEITLEANLFYSFDTDEFPYVNGSGDEFGGIKIISLPENGQLHRNGPVVVGQNISAQQISSFYYYPIDGEDGDPYTSFEYKVFDGNTYSEETYTLTIVVTPYIYPTSEDFEVTTEANIPFTFNGSLFTYVDESPSGGFTGIGIESLPTEGQLFLNDNPVENGQLIYVTTIGGLQFVPDLDEVGEVYTSFDFKVYDFITLSEETYTVTINVIPYIYPTSEDFEITLEANDPYTFDSNEFAYVDESPSGNLNAIRIVSLPDEGQLLFDGDPVGSNQLITTFFIETLQFIPDLDEGGEPYTSFDFKVYDGMEFSEETYTTTINVINVSNPIALSNLFETFSLQLSPNPTKEILNLEIEWIEVPNAFTIEVIDTQGKTLYALEEKTSSIRYNRLLDFQQWSKGIYFLRVGSEGQYVVREFILK